MANQNPKTRTILRWLLRIIIVVFVLTGCLVSILLNPSILYKQKTHLSFYTIYHNQPMDPAMPARLNEAARLIQASPLYNRNLKLNLCLNDGSVYPNIVRWIMGSGFAWGFGGNVVLGGKVSPFTNTVETNGKLWNLTQLVVHESAHCTQVDHFGIWHSNPIADYPQWKWEGYPEYIARKLPEQRDLAKNIERYQHTDSSDFWIKFPDGTGTVREYYRFWMLTQYAMQIKGLTFEQLLADNRTDGDWESEMMRWYREQPQR